MMKSIDGREAQLTAFEDFAYLPYSKTFKH